MGGDPRSGATTSPAVQFTAAARRLGAAARAAGLDVPAFRSPPRIDGACRTLRRFPGGAVIAVRVRDRRFDDVVADMVEGLVRANRLTDADAGRVRPTLLDAAHGRPSLPGLPSSGARMAERQTQAA